MCEIFPDLDECRLWQETRRRARKAHRCSSCDAAILPGVEYIVHFSISYDGDPSSNKMCLACLDARAEFAKAHDGIEPQPSYFPEMLQECIHDGDPESDRRWRPMYDALLSRGRAGGTDA